MYFQKSESIAKAHPSLADSVEQIDELIYETGDHPIQPDQLSDSLDIDQDVLERVLKLYESAGILRRESRRYCGKCETLIDDADDPTECDDCEVPFSKVAPDTLEVFTPTNPVMRADDPDTDDDADEPVPFRIQFVGGDRGGTQLNQLQLPKEHAEIKKALKQGAFGKRLELTDPLFAATMDDLSKLYTSKPRMIHFAGHADDRSLSFIKDQELIASAVAVTAKRLETIFRAYPTPIAVVVFNNCHSDKIAEALATSGTVDIAMGWSGKVPDAAAIKFAELLYFHLGHGVSVGSAFDLASSCAVPEDATFQAVIFNRNGMDPKTYFLHDA